ncbi:MAG: hypothetical protein US52_C0001G0003 [candidate division WS6 bacterium GW2011_GWA2_37_6]|uniref:Fido domain-containing protein n=1 Tax=candidate division WS6 bacterium GW2011_GWA2_37_6 TaxID=1619087 RepID=A0A0G0HCR7_9BACT|nr:MAG: hypothetical protein US52_C0001G0003 [candidate division WS6 bacterium GW2011_GWA2_37_6]
MYEPEYKITNSLLNNIVKLEVEKSKIESSQMPTRVHNKLAARAKMLNVFHFAHLIGVKLTLKDAQKISEGKKLQTDDARGTILNNYRNVLEFTRSNVSDSYVDIDLNILNHLNKILLTDWRETWEAKFRTGGEEVDLNLENWATLRDQEIQSIEIQNKIIELLDWYKSSSSKVHNLIRIGIFVERMIAISPYIFANKLTIVAIADFLLFKNGYTQTCFLPTSRNFDIYEDEYLEAWNQKKESGNKSDTLFLERLVRNLSNDMLETREEMVKTLNEEDKSSKKPFLDLNKRQLKILRYLQTIPTVKREDYVQMMDVSTMTAYRDLTELMEKKLVKLEGQGRGTKYMLSNR